MFTNAILLLLAFPLLSNAIKEGPCTLGTRPGSSSLKCTQNGYFELVQCLTDYCVCVDPTTGHEAPRTRTTSNRVTPRCGTCHVEMARVLALNSSQRVPQCEMNYGNYQRKQCANDQKCWCVEPETGRRLTVIETPNHLLTCEPIVPRVDFSLDSTRAAIANKGKKEEVEIDMPPVGSPNCRLRKDSGKTCSAHPAQVQWHFDMESFECLAFKHNGCEGNENRFDTVSDCWHTCKLADMGGCAGQNPPAKDNKGKTIICTGGIVNAKCPTGYTCSMQAFFGICCNTETQDLYQRNYRPTCQDGQPAHKFTSPGGITMSLIGKKCSDNFCPSNTTCRDQEVFAHCCPN
ncbi:thyroglobulin type-1 repeat domain-containing protein [Ditylenchus destructor]|nr:thyroglobulin type-1 repeat domain-containing protein [Ditylenchus destructor]